MTPAAVVQAQLEAYNAHDVDALLALYAPDASQYEQPDQLLAQGSDALRARMTTRFAATRPRAELLHRIAIGRTVIDHERIVNCSAAGTTTRELVAIYEVDENGRIASARFVFGAETRQASA